MKPKKYRKKPEAVEAVRLTETNGQEIIDWVFQNGGEAEFSVDPRYLIVRTYDLDGEIVVPGEYVVLDEDYCFSVLEHWNIVNQYEEVS